MKRRYTRKAVFLLPALPLLFVAGCEYNRRLTDLRVEGITFLSERIILNPSRYAPLAAGIYLRNTFPIDVRVSVSSPYRGQRDLVASYVLPASDVPQWLPVLGLYPDRSNRIRVDMATLSGDTLMTIKERIRTKPVFEELPRSGRTEGSTQDEHEMIFVCYSLRGLFNLQQAVVFDQHGNVRWYSQFPYGYHPMEIQGGAIVTGSHADTMQLAQIDLLGFTRKTWWFGNGENGLRYVHHDIVPMKNGNYLLTVNDVRTDRRENIIAEFSPRDGTVTRTWDLEEILPNVDDLYADLPNTYYRDENGSPLRDTLHIDALDFDDETRDLLVTSQRFGVALVSYDGELLWMLAPHNLKQRNIDPGYDPLQPSDRSRGVNIPRWPADNRPGIMPSLPRDSYLAEFDERDPATWRLSVSGEPPGHSGESQRWHYGTFLLNPVDDQGSVLPEEVVVHGRDHVASGKRAFAWAFRPHAASFLRNGNVMVFDNGFCRNFVPFVTPGSFSRIVEYGIERNASGFGGTVRQVWEYALSPDWSGFCLFIGEADELENGNRLINFGSIGKADDVIRYFNPAADPSVLIPGLERYRSEVLEEIVIVEVDPRAAPEDAEVFRLTVPASERGTVGSYRSAKIRLYDFWK